MLPRNRLRREQVNLLTLKSRLVFIINLIIICALFIFCYTMIIKINEPDRDTMSRSGSNNKIIYEMYDKLSIKEKCTCVAYNVDGGINNKSNVTKLDWGEAFELRKPYKSGFYFKGWFLDSKFTKKITKISYAGYKGIVLYAKWSRVLDNNLSVKKYDYSMSKRLNKNLRYLKDCKYSFLEDVLIPGMPDTREDDWFNRFIYSPSQCPQGLCFTDKFILVTSYSEEDDCLGELMILDRESGKYLFTLGMDPTSHLGGITFDGKNVWVCNSTIDSLERISYDFIELMAEENSGEIVDATDVVDIYKISNVPSCISFYGNRLWVGTHNKILDSKMKAYFYDEKDNELKELSSYKLPPRVQGIAFDDEGCVYLSTSYGRRNSSFLKKYSSVVDLATQPDKPSVDIEMPPGSEEIDIVNNNLYCVFESAGEKYFDGTDGKGLSSSPIDKILQIDLDSL